MSAQPSAPSSELRTFIAEVIVPALLERFLAEHQRAATSTHTPDVPPRIQSHPDA